MYKERKKLPFFNEEKKPHIPTPNHYVLKNKKEEKENIDLQLSQLWVNWAEFWVGK